MARQTLPELRLSYLQSVLDCTRDALFVIRTPLTQDQEHRICFVNDAFTRMTGYTQAEACDRPSNFFLENGSGDLLDGALRRSEKFRHTIDIRRNDGTAARLEVFLNPLVEQDECQFIIAILQPARLPVPSAATRSSTDSRLTAILDNVNEAVLVHQDKHPLFANAAYVDLFGFTNSEEALREISPLMNLPLGDFEVGETVRCEALRTDGQAVPITLRKNTIDWNGRPAVQLTIARATRQTENLRVLARRKCAPPRLQEADSALMAEFLDSLPVILAHKSLDLHYTYVNKTYADWVDIPREQIVGNHVSQVRNEAHYQMMKPRREAVLSGKVVQYITQCEYPGRGMCDLFTTLIPRRDSDGVITGYFSMAQDISEQKDAERILMRREEQLQLVVDSVPALISYRDRNLCYRYVNKPFAEWYGVRREDMIGCYMTDFMDLSTFRRVKPDLDRVLAGERFRQVYEDGLRQENAAKLIVDYVPHEDENNNVVGFFALGQTGENAVSRAPDATLSPNQLYQLQKAAFDQS